MNTYSDIEKQESNSHNPPSLGSSQTASISTFTSCKFAWKNVSYSVDTPAGKKQILTNVNGCVEKGLFENS